MRAPARSCSPPSTAAGSGWPCSTARPGPRAASAWPSSSRTSWSTAPPRWCWSPARTTPGWRSGRWPTASSTLPVDPPAAHRRCRRAAAPLRVGGAGPPYPRPVARVTRTWGALLSRLLAGESLSTEDTAWAMTEVMRGDATPAQTAGFVIALRAKGETAEEVAGLVDVMLAVRHPCRRSSAASWTPAARAATAPTPSTSRRWRPWWSPAPACRSSSTAAGPSPRRPARPTCSKRSASSWTCPPRPWRRASAEAGIAFCFAPVFHPGMRHAAVARRELGHRHGLQHPRPADQPGSAGGAVDRRLRGAAGAGDGGRPGRPRAPTRWSSAATTAWTS